MKTMRDLANQMKRTRETFERQKKNLPHQIGNAGTRMFVANFAKQGFEGDAWKEVKRRIPGTTEYKYPKTHGTSRRRKAILNMTGALRKAVNASLFTATWNRIYWRVSSDYGGYQNYGGKNLPQRKFIGGSPQLKAKILEMIAAGLKKTFATR